jgi:hypothetical protein
MKDELPPCFWMKKIGFVRLPLDTLQNFWQIIMCEEKTYKSTLRPCEERFAALLQLLVNHMISSTWYFSSMLSSSSIL